MQMEVLTRAQGRALESIDDRHRLARPGSRPDQAMDKAKDYVIGRRASASAFLEHDATRDAYKSTRRRATNERRLLQDVAALTAPDGNAVRPDVQHNGYPTYEGPARACSETTRRGGGGGRLAATSLVNAVTPEDHAIAQSMERDLTTAVKQQLGIPGLKVLKAMLLFMTIDETAEALDVATSTVELYRKKIRVIARPILMPHAA